jgi:hypothetical protein
MSAVRLSFAILWVVASVILPRYAQATGNSCSVSGATAASIGDYNPFTGSSFNQVQVNLNLTRYVASGGKKTQQANFYLAQASGSPAGLTILYQNFNVLYTLPATHSLALSNPPSGTVFADFGGNGQPDTIQIPFVVTIPPGLDLSSGKPMSFDLVYICSGTGGLLSTLTPTTLANAITLQINVLSALQASYAGPPLDFGEVGGISDAQAAAHSETGAIRIASSGPFTVAMTSANSYRMTFAGGDLGNSAETIKYAVRLLGQTKERTNATFATVACKRAGIASENLSIAATLREGGETKTPAPNYYDSLTVTLTPLFTPYGGATVDCANMQ